jgi:hypothetical protein
VALKADSDSMGMHPRILPGAIVLLDRHYHSLAPYRRGEMNIYAVQVNDACKLRYVEVSGHNLVPRPQNQTYPVQVLPLEEGKSAHDCIVSRICYVGMEI